MDELLNAVKKSIKAYYEDEAFENSSKLGEVKYTKSYFDEFEKKSEGKEDELVEEDGVEEEMINEE